MIIESPQNSAFKQALLLKEKKYRQQTGTFLVEGHKQIEEIKNGWKTVRFFVSESFLSKNGSYAKNEITLSDPLFKKLSSTQTPQGIIAVVEKKSHDIGSVLSGNGFFILLENIQDPGNLGTIIRSADAFGAKGVFVSKESADIYSDKTIRSTMGSLFHIPVIDNIEIKDITAAMKKEKITVFASSLAAERGIENVSFKGRCAVIIGNESKGLKPETLKEADKLIKIGMPGKAESLNAAIAASVIMYEIASKTGF